MSLIKQLYNKFFYKAPETKSSHDTKEVSFEEDIIIATIGLTPQYDVDVSLEIKELSITSEEDLSFKAQKIATFFYSITSGSLNNTIIEFLMREMSDETNKKLFETIVYNWLILEKYHEPKTKERHASIPVVSPLKVFVQHLEKNNT